RDPGGARGQDQRAARDGGVPRPFRQARGPGQGRHAPGVRRLDRRRARPLDQGREGLRRQAELTARYSAAPARAITASSWRVVPRSWAWILDDGIGSSALVWYAAGRMLRMSKSGATASMSKSLSARS